MGSPGVGMDTPACRLFDATTEQWSDLPDMIIGRGNWPGIVAVRRTTGHRIYVIGGRRENRRYDCCEFIDVEEKNIHWTLLEAKMTFSRSSTCAILLDHNTVVICGGFADDGPLASCESLDLTTHTFSPFPDMLEPRAGHAAVLYNETIVVLGGYGPMKTCEQFDPAVCKWTPFAPLRKGRSYIGAAVIENNIYVVGELDVLDIYDGSAWSFVTRVPCARTHASSVALGGKLVVLSETDDIDVFDTATNTWSSLPNGIRYRCISAVSF